MFSCGGSDSSDSDHTGTWTGYVKIMKRGSETAVNSPYYPLVMTISADKSFTLVYYFNGKEAMTINGIIDDSNGKLNTSVHMDFPYDDSLTSKATFAFTTTVGANDIGTGIYSIKYDDSSIGATSDESGEICVTTKTIGIVGTWYGGYQGSNGAYDGLVKVTFNDNGTFTATHYEIDSNSSNFSFTGTYKLTDSSFKADSTGKFSDSINNHTGTYTASLKGSILNASAYTVDTGSTYTGIWALAKELK